MLPSLRFLRHYLRPSGTAVASHETSYRRGEDELAATVYRPARARRPLPGWVVLHGLAFTGRHHPSLVPFVRAVAGAGNIVLVPDIPEWRALRVAPAVTVETIRSAVRALQARDDVLHEHAGLFGFSFGATQAIIAASEADMPDLLNGIAAWGGYSDVYRLFDFAMTGEHELDGRRYRVPPDPYGAWVMTGNYLTAMPGYEDAAAVARALHELALDAGRQGVFAWDPVYDASKDALRAGLDGSERELFDLIAPVSTAPPQDVEEKRRLARLLADAVLRVDPLIDPSPFLPHLRVPTLFAHGRDDRLIPFTETLRLCRAVPAGVVRGCTITSLFAHSGGTRTELGVFGKVREGARFVGLLQRTLKLV
jgi:pimeloyl-ACP methyl ester carboxylesterase